MFHRFSGGSSVLLRSPHILLYFPLHCFHDYTMPTSSHSSSRDERDKHQLLIDSSPLVQHRNLAVKSAWGAPRVCLWSCKTMMCVYLCFQQVRPLTLAAVLRRLDKTFPCCTHHTNIFVVSEDTAAAGWMRKKANGAAAVRALACGEQNMLAQLPPVGWWFQ